MHEDDETITLRDWLELNFYLEKLYIPDKNNPEKIEALSEIDVLTMKKYLDSWIRIKFEIIGIIFSGLLLIFLGYFFAYRLSSLAMTLIICGGNMVIFLFLLLNVYNIRKAVLYKKFLMRKEKI